MDILEKLVKRHRKIDMKAHHLFGIHRPPVLHQYKTRLKRTYVELANRLKEDLGNYDARMDTKKLR